MRAESRAFTVCHVVAYLIPGILCNFFFLKAFHTSFAAQFFEANQSAMTVVMDTLIFLVFSYALGHLISFVSTYSLENFLKLCGGTSVHSLLTKESEKSAFSARIRKKRHAFLNKTGVLRWFTLIVFPHYVLFKSLCARGKSALLTPSLSDQVIDDVSATYQSDVKQELDFDDSGLCARLEHMALSRNNPARKRLDDWAFLYGFLRNMSLALYLAAGFYFFDVLSKIMETILFNSPFTIADLFNLYYMASFIFLSLCLAVGFGYAYRKYGEEIILSYVYATPQNKLKD